MSIEEDLLTCIQSKFGWVGDTAHLQHVHLVVDVMIWNLKIFSVYLALYLSKVDTIDIPNKLNQLNYSSSIDILLLLSNNKYASTFRLLLSTRSDRFHTPAWNGDLETRCSLEGHSETQLSISPEQEACQAAHRRLRGETPCHKREGRGWREGPKAPTYHGQKAGKTVKASRLSVGSGRAITTGADPSLVYNCITQVEAILDGHQILGSFHLFYWNKIICPDWNKCIELSEVNHNPHFDFMSFEVEMKALFK